MWSGRLNQSLLLLLIAIHILFSAPATQVPGSFSGGANLLFNAIQRVSSLVFNDNRKQAH